MSLVRLLTMSQTVDGKSTEPSRYKMGRPLPKFAPVKRPISLAPAKVEQREKKKNMETPSLFAQSEARETGAAEQSTAPQEQVGVLSIGVFQSAFQSAEAPAASAPEAEPKEGWVTKMTGFFRRKPAADGASVAGPVVQTEWSLDKVKVVRNDLSDADLDIVFASVENQPEVKKEPVKKQELVSSAWRRVNPNPAKSDQMVLK